MDSFFLHDCRIRPSERIIERNGEAQRIEPRAMDLLLLLVARVGEVVTRQEIEDRLWEGRVVGYDALTQTVAKLRRALGDDAHEPSFLLTIPKGGYKLAVAPETRDAGEQRLAVAEAPSLAAPMVPANAAPRGPNRLWRLMGGALLVLVAIAGIGWMSQEAPPAARPATALERRPALAVLPFLDRSNDDDYAYVADGLTEDLITTLTHISELNVLALTSTTGYKSQPFDAAAVRRALGARYVVTGAVQADQASLRVHVQLIDAESESNLWAEKYDRPRAEWFALRDELADAISSRVLPNVQEAEKRRARRKPTENLDAYDLFQRARSEKHKLTVDSEREAVTLLRRAIELDPNFAEAHALLGWVGALERLFGGTGASYEESLAQVQRSLELHPQLSIGYQALTQVLTFMKRFEEATQAGLRAIEINPNDAENHIFYSRAASTAGYYEPAVAAAERAVALNPMYPKWYPYIFARALYADGQIARAVEICADGMARQPFVATTVTCIAVFERASRHDEAAAHARTLNAAPIPITVAHAQDSWGFREAALNERFADDLTAAGLRR
ncbi:winged helix-turn-helix domain-containing protein [Aromatoleum evansii]|uniref:Winged helix-turn-helix domain-containing protein n=1 Tax=Aromatoleum evansii TaxID=59406 RepID=A0ABZ1AHK6_AROEV|nr:winged helix-turn-helix domain-containing protein [Aromatoleum evansii]NMG28539.1 hypothetical protein [Aromatoleum evansii]WRL45347.1 winged helix-turn-helix domain-containing protein [Aromatoleum evansii]